MVSIYKGDDTNAFGQHFIKVNMKNAENYTITKCIFQCGPIQKIYKNPTFPFYIDFTKEETKKLYQNSECYLQVYDAQGLCLTCNGSLKFVAKPQVVATEHGQQRQLHRCRDCC